MTVAQALDWSAR